MDLLVVGVFKFGTMLLRRRDVRCMRACSSGSAQRAAIDSQTYKRACTAAFSNQFNFAFWSSYTITAATAQTPKQQRTRARKVILQG